MNFFQKLLDFVRSPGHSRTTAVIALLLIFAAIPLTVIISQQQQQIRQRAACTQDYASCVTTYNSCNQICYALDQKNYLNYDAYLQSYYACTDNCANNDNICNQAVDNAYYQCLASTPTPTPIPTVPPPPTPTPISTSTCGQLNQQCCVEGTVIFCAFGLECKNNVCTTAAAIPTPIPTLPPGVIPIPTATPTTILSFCPVNQTICDACIVDSGTCGSGTKQCSFEYISTVNCQKYTTTKLPFPCQITCPTPTPIPSSQCGINDCGGPGACAVGSSCQQVATSLIKNCTCQSSQPTSTPTPTPTSTPTLTPTPTPIPVPVPTPLPGSTLLALSVKVSGLGLAPENLPHTISRPVIVIVRTATEDIERPGTLVFSTSDGLFKTDPKRPVDLGLSVPINTPLDLVIKVDFFKGFVFDISLSQGSNPAPPTPTLQVGLDASGNVDAVSYYNALVSCFGAKSCTNELAADLNDDGSVDGVDFNIFLKSIQTLTTK